MERGETFLTLAEVAKLLHLSKSKLYQERLADKLRVLRFGRTVRVRETDLQQYIQGAAK